MIKQAIISAGGFGNRLRPTTDTMPKPMIPILGEPMLLWHVMQFKKHGVTEFFFTLHYLPEVVMNYFGDGSKFGVKMHYFVEQSPMGSAGAIKKFEPERNIRAEIRLPAKRPNHHHCFIRDEGQKKERGTDTSQRLGGRAIDMN